MNVRTLKITPAPVATTPRVKPRIPTPSQLASALRLPGCQVTATWDPTMLPPRIRSSAKKMLRQGITQGWGEAANVARVVAKKVDLTLTPQSARRYTIPALSQEMRPRAEALINAHFTSALLLGNNGGGWKAAYAERERAAALADVRAGKSTNVGLHYTKFPTATRELWNTTFAEMAAPSPAELVKRERALALLDSATPIPFHF